jgi:hypothetical protein
MKIIITENKVFDSIYHYIDDTFDRDEINWVYGIDYDSEGNDDGDFNDDEDIIMFYKGIWDGEDYSDIVFIYIMPDYYGNSPSSKSHKDRAPILEVRGDHAKHLDDMFGNYWKEPIKKWVQDKLNLPVKTVSTYY